MPRVIIHIIACCLVIPSLSASIVAAQEQGIGRCEEQAAVLEVAEGVVEYRRGSEGAWQQAQVGTEFCYGEALRVVQFRAAIRLNNDTLVRLKEGSSVRFMPPDKSFWVELIEGAAHFISRTPRSFKVKAPYVNAVVEGTEFLVASQTELDRVSVVEGRVLAQNAYGQVLVTDSKTALAYPDRAPVIDPGASIEDMVNWSFYYPALLLPEAMQVPAVKQSILAGQYAKALAKLEQKKAELSELDYLNLKADLLLALGAAGESQRLLSDARSLDPNSISAASTQAMFYLAQGKVVNAQETLKLLLRKHPSDAELLFVDSYIKQAQLDLEGAYKSALSAAENEPSEYTLWLRAAQLAFYRDQLKQSENQFEKAEKLAPSAPEVLILKGMLALKNMKYKKASALFERVVKLDNTNPKAHLLSGLTDIRLGKLERGRKKVELAVLLDPNNSVIRSYMGRVYSEEFKFDKSTTQFDLAKLMDPDDPTPYFYQGLQYQLVGNPIRAVQEFEISVEKNNNRQVYRSRNQLNSDLSARSADLAGSYQELGLGFHAYQIAARAKSMDPTDSAAAKTMAFILSENSRYDKAGASEYLQAQITQPLTSNPIRSLQAEKTVNAPKAAGPKSVGNSEYNSLLDMNRFNYQLSGALGSDENYTIDGLISGLHNKISFLSEFYKNTSEGLPGTESVDYELANAFFQIKPSVNSNFFIDLKSRDSSFLGFAVPSPFFPISKDEKNTVSGGLLGYSYRQKSNFAFDISISASDRKKDLRQVVDYSLPDDPFFVVDYRVIDDSDVATDVKVLSGFSLGSIILGAQDYRLNGTSSLLQYVQSEGPESASTESADIGQEFLNKYFYFKSKSIGLFSFILGYSDSHYEEEDFGSVRNGIDHELYKAALNFSINQRYSFDLAYFDGLATTALNSPTLEITNLFGLNQFFDDRSGAISENISLSFSGSQKNFMFSGYAIDRKVYDLRPYLSFGERATNIQVATVLDRVVLTASAEISSVDFSDNSVDENIPVQLDTKAYPVGLSYVMGNISINAEVAYVDQKADLLSSGWRAEKFEIFDFSVEANLTKYTGSPFSASISIRNLFDKEFEYIDDSVLGNAVTELNYFQKYSTNRNFLLSFRFQL